MEQTIITLLAQFRNEVLCRHEPNQEKAVKIWVQLKPMLKPDEVLEIVDDWVHYIGGGSYVETNEFGRTLKNISAKYEAE